MQPTFFGLRRRQGSVTTSLLLILRAFICYFRHPRQVTVLLRSKDWKNFPAFKISFSLETLEKYFSKNRSLNHRFFVSHFRERTASSIDVFFSQQTHFCCCCLLRGEWLIICFFHLRHETKRPRIHKHRAIYKIQLWSNVANCLSL